MQKKAISKGKEWSFRIRKRFYGFERKRIEKQKRKKIKRGTKELLYNLIIVSKDDMDKFEQQELKKIRPIKKNGMIG